MSSRRFNTGTRLRYPIYDDRGVLLLKEGTELNNKLVGVLDKRGIRLRLHASLRILSGPMGGSEIPIPDTCTVTIGRAEGCAIRSSNPLVSSYHAAITQLPLALLIEDKGSTNGTFINGEPIQVPTELRDGDKVQFGDNTLVVHLYACIEGETQEVKDIAGVILTDTRCDIPSVPSGKTISAAGEEASNMQAALQAAWEKRQQKKKAQQD
ncbi:MAG: FHA domain-containing protein [Planctomycetota bacterium]